MCLPAITPPKLTKQLSSSMTAQYEAGVAAIRNELELEKLLPPIKTNPISRKILSTMLTASRNWSAERERGSCEVYTLYDEIRQPKRFSGTPIKDLRPSMLYPHS